MKKKNAGGAMLLKYVYILYFGCTTNRALLIPISISYLYATYQSEKRKKEKNRGFFNEMI